MTSNKHSKILQQKTMDMEVIKLVRKWKKKNKEKKKIKCIV
jgi:hypothetical protein